MTVLNFDILARDRASAVFDKVGDSAKKTGGAFGAIAKGAAGAAGVAIAVGVAAFKMGEQFDSAYDRIRIGTGATGDRLAGLRDDFRNVVKSIPTDFDSASIAITELSKRTGLAGEPLQKLAKQFLEFSRITRSDVTTNVRSITRVFGDWSIATDKQERALDMMFRASQLTGIGVQQLTDTVVQFGAPLRNLGFSFEESIALLGKWEKEGVNVETALAGLKKAFATFAKSGKDPVKALDDVIEKIRTTGSVAEANQLAIKTFGAKAGPDLVAAIREGRFELGKLFDAMKNGTDTIAEASKDTQDFTEKWQVFKNRVMLGLETTVVGVFDAIGKLGDKLQPLISWVREHFGPLIAWMIVQFEKLKGPALKGLVIAFVVAAAIIVGTLLAVGLAIAGIVVAVEFVVNNVGKWWEVLKNNTLSTWNSIIGGITTHWAVLKSNVTTAVNGVVMAVQVGWDSIKRQTETIWQGIRIAIVIPIQQALAAVLSVVRGILAGIDMLGSIPSRVIGFFRAAARGAVEAFNELFAWVRSIPGRISAAVGDLGGVLFGAGKAVIRGLINGIRSMIGELTNVLSIVTRLMPVVKGPISKDLKLLVPNGIAIMQGLLRGLSQGFTPVERLLSGVTGDISSTVGVNAGAPLPALAPASTMASTTGGSVSISFNGPVGSPTELRDWLARALDELDRSGRLPVGMS